MPSENSSEPTSEFLTTDELDALLSLDDTLTLGKVVPTDRRPPDPRRKRQTYRPRYRSMMQAWARRLRAYHMDLGRFYAIAHARSKDIKSGNTALPTEPSVGLVDWWQRRFIRVHREAVHANLMAVLEARGIDAGERRKAQYRNSKLRRSAETYRSGEDRSRLYQTDRKLMSPEDRKAHDLAKRTAGQKERRKKARERSPSEKVL